MDRLLNDAMKTRMTKPVNCPDAEQLAAWADGSIYGAAAEGIESHLADCDRCQAVIAAFVTSEPEVASAPVATISACRRVRSDRSMPLIADPSVW